MKTDKAKTAKPKGQELGAAMANLKRALESHGGGIELISFREGTVKVRLRGACVGCPMASMTLKHTVEAYLKANVPGVRRVVAVE
jgi:Fe-S cluster biogenesis protein NfuA